ncbi:MAG: hypothetical protein E7625_00525 [Ruminococcaceae bacterium]|nr:hypothetical protein [Oscillospiraceae bacterium]
MIKGFVQGQTLKLAGAHIVSDTLDYLVARFSFFGDDWTGLHKWVHLQKGDQLYAIKLTDDATRKEDHLNLSAGEWSVWLHGNETVDGQVIERITTNACTFTVEQSGALEGEAFEQLPASEAEQLDARIAALENAEREEQDLPCVSAEDEGKLLEVVDGQWQAVEVPIAHKTVEDALSEESDNLVTSRAIAEALEQYAKKTGAVLCDEAQELTDAQKERARVNIDALGCHALQPAIDEALAQAKESGAFDGRDGEDGITPLLRINEESGEWECSYDQKQTWLSLGVKATAMPEFSEQNKIDPKYIDAEWLATKETVSGGDEVWSERELAFTSKQKLLPYSGLRVLLGITYDVHWNGVVYPCVAFEQDSELFLGNRDLLAGASGTLVPTDAPFCFSGYGETINMVTKETSAATTVTVMVETHKEYTYNKLPPEYLPDDIGGSIDVTAQPGQTIVVKEVDENGKPTAWESADYQEKICYTEVVEADIVPETTFTASYNSAFGMYIFSLPAFELEAGKTYTVVFDGVEYVCVARSGAMQGINYISIGNEMLVGGANTGEPCAVSHLTDMGVYAVQCMDENEHTLRVAGKKTVNHKIPQEYLPKSDFLLDCSYSPTGGFPILRTPWEDIIEAAKAGKNIYATLATTSSTGESSYAIVRYYRCIILQYATDGSQGCSIFLVGCDDLGSQQYIGWYRNEEGETVFVA